MSRPPYVVVAGHGRSGTCWLLDLLDLSAETFCRNEPYGIDGSPLARLDRFRAVVRSDRDELAAAWDGAVRWTARHMGERDRPVRLPKRHLWSASRRAGVYRVVRGPRLRRCLAVVTPALRNGEWPVPWWLGSQRKLADAVPVLKLLAAPGWVSFVLAERPQVLVTHIVRHPGGTLNSGINRYFRHHDRSEVRAASRSRIEQVVAEEPGWRERVGDIDAMSIEELELWYWAYSTERIHRLGSRSGHYELVLYEDLAQDPVTTMKRLFAACSLEWTRRIEDAVLADSADSTEIASRWRDELSPRLVPLVERVLESSLMRGWWR